MLNSKNIYFYLGAAVSQLLTIITSFIILKAVDSAEYGNYSYFVSVASIIGSIATLKFEQSIVISKGNNESLEKVSLTLVLSFLSSLVMVGIYSVIDKKLNFSYIFLVFSLSFVIALYACITQILLFREKHRSNGLLSVFNALFFLIFVILLRRRTNGLEIAYFLSSFVACLIFIVILEREKVKIRPLSFSKYKSVFNRNALYPIYVLPGAIFSILLTYGHQVCIKYLFNDSDLGLFSLSLRLLLLPSILIGTVAAGLFRTSLSKSYLNGDYKQVSSESKKIAKFLIITALIMYIPLLIVLYNLHFFLKLKGWDGIGNVSIFLVLFAISQYIFVPLSNIALVCDEKSLLFRMNLYQFIFILIVYITTYLFKLTFFHFLLYLSVVSFLFCIYSGLTFINIGNRIQLKRNIDK